VPGSGLGVVDHCVGDHPYSVPGRVHSPAEINVLREQAHVGVEAADQIPGITTDEHADAADGQHVAVAVMLALISLARLDASDPPADAVDRHPRLEDHVTIGQVPCLGSEHRRRRSLGCAAQQLPERVRAGSQSSCNSQIHSARSLPVLPGGPGTLTLAALCRRAPVTAAA